MSNPTLDPLKDWIGRTERRSEFIAGAPIAALSATLDRDDPPPQPGDEVPILWHWLYFLPNQRHSGTGEDGHAKRGGFLPPVPLPRRMFAGARLEFIRPLRIGSTVTRESKIANVSMKEGKTGSLVFVLVRHELSDDQGVAIVEENDIVYREAPQPGAPPPKPQPSPAEAQWAREIVPNEVLLFRYSALTFNAHRIHYDHPYATAVEGYPALVVHGVLIATFVADLLRRSLPDATVRNFAFRSVAPIYNDGPFTVCGRANEANAVGLWAHDRGGALALDASATLA